MFSNAVDFTPLVVAIFSSVGLVVFRSLGTLAITEGVKLLTP